MIRFIYWTCKFEICSDTGIMVLNNLDAHLATLLQIYKATLNKDIGEAENDSNKRFMIPSNSTPLPPVFTQAVPALADNQFGDDEFRNILAHDTSHPPPPTPPMDMAVLLGMKAFL
jgi:hypothetical protein